MIDWQHSNRFEFSENEIIVSQYGVGGGCRCERAGGEKGIGVNVEMCACDAIYVIFNLNAIYGAHSDRHNETQYQYSCIVFNCISAFESDELATQSLLTISLNDWLFTWPSMRAELLRCWQSERTDKRHFFTRKTYITRDKTRTSHYSVEATSPLSLPPPYNLVWREISISLMCVCVCLALKYYASSASLWFLFTTNIASKLRTHIRTHTLFELLIIHYARAFEHFEHTHSHICAKMYTKYSFMMYIQCTSTILFGEQQRRRQ